MMSFSARVKKRRLVFLHGSAVAHARYARHFGSARCRIHYWLTWCKNYRTSLRYSKVISKSLLSPFFMDHSEQLDDHSVQLDNWVSQSTDQPHGTVCHQHYGHWTCRRAPSSGHSRHTCSQPPGTIETSS